jgi:hypothetical protein
MGVVWGDGNGAANHHGPALGAGISDWLQRLIHVAWRRASSALMSWRLFEQPGKPPVGQRLAAGLAGRAVLQ